MAQLEVLPVPPDYVPKLWNSARKVVLSKIPGYDVERTHQRLLLGVDQLWIAHSSQRLCGVVITTISSKPPQQRIAFLRKDRARMKSLVIHIAGEHSLLSWLDSAVERITRYARENGCRMLFVSCRRGWHKWMYHRWYSREWEAVAIGRDRPTASKCQRLAARNKAGYYRLMVPVPADKFNRYMYAIMSICYFKEAA